MAYFRHLEEQLAAMLDLMRKNERWLIIINADPDAMASAMALKRILSRRVADVGIAQVNEIKRPDNLAMIKYLRIPTNRLTPPLAAQYDRFALIDSQPHHHPDFEGFRYSIVIDHHPPVPDRPVLADYVEIQPDYGAVSTIMTEYLYNLGIQPGMLLATALLYGIKTDTQSFERNFLDVDVRAFRYLSKFANKLLLRKIGRSEFRLDWLGYFSHALSAMRQIDQGIMVYMGEVENPDILVVLADFFLRVHGVTWDMVAGTSKGTLVAIFRGDGLRRDMGRFAARIFDGMGPAGGHKSMARAEIPLSKFTCDVPEIYIWKKLVHHGETPSPEYCPIPANSKR